MDENWTKNYPLFEGITAESLGENHSLIKMLHLIGDNKRVVDFGCATGYFAELLNRKGCTVTGVEINPDAAEVAKQYCQEVKVADLDFASVVEIFPSQEFDVAVFGDVLEHLRNPWKVLEETKHILKKDGFVVASIPNIAHGSIRLALLQGRFDYSEVGILDNTHLRFFTRKTVEDLFESSGYLLSCIDTTKVEIFADNYCIPKNNKQEFNSELIKQIEHDENADTLQFIVQAIPCTIEKKYAVINEQYSKLQKTHQQLQTQLNFTQAELEQTQAQLKQNQPELQRLQSQWQQSQQELERSQSQLHQTQAELERSRSQLHQTQAELKKFQSLVPQINAQLQQLKNIICAMESSKFWQLRSLWFQVRHSFGIKEDNIPLHKSLLSKVKGLWIPSQVKKLGYATSQLLKKNTPTLDDISLAAYAQLGIPQSNDINYQNWLNKHYPTQATLQKMAEMVEVLAYKPVISIVMPVYNTSEYFLREAIESVLNQVYPYWELCIADDASSDKQVQEILKDYSAKDSRIKVVFRTQNGHISRCSNSALEIATGEFIALLDHDDLLTPDALYEVALLLNKHPQADMIYSDEDKIDEFGKLQSPYFKPDWCPDSFLSRMYTCHLGTYRRELVNTIGGFREGYEGSQDYDLVLRFTEKTTNIFHIPKILYHWRIHSNSCSSEVNIKPYAVVAAEKALTDALARRGEPGRIIPAGKCLGHHIVRYTIADYKLVSIIIPTRDLGEILDKCLTSIFEKTIYPNYEVILIDNGSQEEKTAKIIAKWQVKEEKRFQCYRLDIPFNYSKINNYAVQQAKGDYLLFLNNDIEVITPDWVDGMVEQAQRSSIGAVGALLLYPDNTVQHAGVVMGIGGIAGHSHKYYADDKPGYFHQLLTVNNYSAVTAACLMCRRQIFEAIGGFEEQLKIAFNDVDLCLRILEKGYKNIYLPHVVLYHYESKSRGYEDTPEKQARFRQEIEYMYMKWQKYIDYDPCYNINLTRQHEDYSISI
jgi:glycosyltransferase involved in cell wall biosynthesis/SAM-dependent methyltransferase